MHPRMVKLARLVDESKKMAHELIYGEPIRFRRGSGVLLYLLARCGYYDQGLERGNSHEELPESLRIAVQSLVIANELSGPERRAELATALSRISRIIPGGIGWATGMAHALNRSEFTTQYEEG